MCHKLKNRCSMTIEIFEDKYNWFYNFQFLEYRHHKRKQKLILINWQNYEKGKLYFTKPEYRIMCFPKPGTVKRRFRINSTNSIPVTHDICNFLWNIVYVRVDVNLFTQFQQYWVSWKIIKTYLTENHFAIWTAHDLSSLATPSAIQFTAVFVFFEFPACIKVVAVFTYQYFKQWVHESVSLSI